MFANKFIYYLFYAVITRSLLIIWYTLLYIGENKRCSSFSVGAAWYLVGAVSSQWVQPGI